MNDRATKTAADRLPPQTRFIVGNEACERFSYYGMRSILAGYITGAVAAGSKGGLGQSADTSTSIIHLFVFANYFMPLLGAWLSDKLIGRYYTILYVSLFYCAGHGVLACSDLFVTVQSKIACLCTGLGLIAFGSGGIKPCVSAFMGDQFKPDQGHLLQKAYGAFYWAINFGSFFSFLAIPFIKNHWGYSWAFGVPGIAMAVATLIFWSGTKHYVRIPPLRQTKAAGFIPVFLRAFRNQARFALLPLVNILTTLGLPLAAMVILTGLGLQNELSPAWKTVGWVGMGAVALWYFLIVSLSFLGRSELGETFWQAARTRHSEQEIAAARSVSPILFVFALIPVFWALFDQTNSTWVLQGGRMSAFNFFGLAIGAEEMQSANPAIVMVLVPLFTLGLYPRIGRFATPLKRMSAGMFLGAVSYVIVAWLQVRVDGYWIWAAQQCSAATAALDPAGPLGPPFLALLPAPSVLWQTVPYIVLTAGEVLLSTTGLEFAFAEAAPEMRSTIMSFWLLTVAFGDLVVVAITKLLGGAGHAGSVTAGRFLLYAALTAAVAVLFSLVATRYRYRHPSFQKLVS